MEYRKAAITEGVKLLNGLLVGFSDGDLILGKYFIYFRNLRDLVIPYAVFVSSNYKTTKQKHNSRWLKLKKKKGKITPTKQDIYHFLYNELYK